MPPRLPTPSSTSVISRSLLRPFSTTPASLQDASGAPNSRLANLSNNNHQNNHNNNGAQAQGGNRRGDAASRLLDRFKARNAAYGREKSAQLEVLKNQKVSNDYLRQMPRKWEAGDVYSPHDLSPVEMTKWKRRTQRNNDVVDALGISPLDMYKNFSLIEHFTTPSAMISHSRDTRLRPVNQRKVAKMIRRVQGMGIYPSVHAHPEMLREQFFSRR